MTPVILLTPIPSSPISYLPDELLLLIFKYHQPQASTWKLFSSKRHLRSSTSTTSRALYDSVKQEATGWLAILHTCFRWRAVALEYGPFWSNVIVEQKQTVREVEEGREERASRVRESGLTETMLRRSKEVDLAVTYFHGEDDQRVFETILEDITRVRHLHILGSDQELCKTVTTSLARRLREDGTRRDALKSLIYATLDADFKASMPIMDQEFLSSLPPSLSFLAFCGQIAPPFAPNTVIPRALDASPINLEHLFLCLTPPINVSVFESALTHLPRLQSLSLRLRTFGASPGAFITLPPTIPLLPREKIPLPELYMLDYEGPLFVYHHLSSSLIVPTDAHRHLTLSVNVGDVTDVKEVIVGYRESLAEGAKFEKVGLGITRRSPEYLGMGNLELDLYASSPSSFPSTSQLSIPEPIYPRPPYDPCRPPTYTSLFLTLKLFFVSNERLSDITTELFETVGCADVRALGLRVNLPPPLAGENERMEWRGVSVPTIGSLRALRKLEVKGDEGLASFVGWLQSSGQAEAGLAVMNELVLDAIDLNTPRLEALLEVLNARKQDKLRGLKRLLLRGVSKSSVDVGLIGRFRDELAIELVVQSWR